MHARVVFALLALLLTANARAGQQCTSVTVPSTLTDWNQTLTFPRFDPALGTLNTVSLTVTGSLTGSGATESLDTAPVTVMMNIAAQASVRRPNGMTLVSTLPSASFTDNLTAFDGTIDFAGPSGVTHSGVATTSTGSIVIASPADLLLFTGPAGNPGTIGLPVAATGMSVLFGANIVQFSTSVGALVTVCYDYSPGVLSFCPGDGSGTACPCGNASFLGSGRGCLNSNGVGAQLTGDGNASVSNDTLVLTCGGLPAGTSTLFFQGTAQQNGGNGAVFGDGLRCVTGSVVRLAIKAASVSVATYPGAGDAPISVRGSVPANAVRHYQTWYRNIATFCTSSTFNLSQGLTLTWSP